jgi:geranylgeranyl diphosphate synthase, type I
MAKRNFVADFRTRGPKRDAAIIGGQGGCCYPNPESIVTASQPILSPAPDFVDALLPLRAELETRLAGFLALKLAEAEGAAPLVEAVARLVAAGGKRLRPLLVLASYEACGGGERERAWPLALAVELLHTYLLVHDDIMDHAPLRRGRPTAHVVFEDYHAERRLRGDGADFGRSIAILVGDLAGCYATELFGRIDADRATVRRLLQIWDEMTQEVVRGQFLELEVALREEASEADLLSILRLKSGRYSVERPIELGAVLAGAAPHHVEGLGRLGHALGEAFQLRDDLLGLFGEPEETGKPVGSDLVEGKFTFLLHHALAAATAADRQLLAHARGNPAASSAEVEAAVRRIRELGAEAKVEAMITERLERARRALDELDLAPASRSFFAGLIRYSEERRQ